MNKPSALDTLLKIDTPKTVNGVIKDNYIDCYIVTSVACKACGNAAVASNPVVCNDKDAVKKTGKDFHKQIVAQNKVLCLKPLLVINYTLAFIDMELLK